MKKLIKKWNLWVREQCTDVLFTENWSKVAATVHVPYMNSSRKWGENAWKKENAETETQQTQSKHTLRSTLVATLGPHLNRQVHTNTWFCCVYSVMWHGASWLSILELFGNKEKIGEVEKQGENFHPGATKFFLPNREEKQWGKTTLRQFYLNALPLFCFFQSDLNVLFFSFSFFSRELNVLFFFFFSSVTWTFFFCSTCTFFSFFFERDLI